MKRPQLLATLKQLADQETAPYSEAAIRKCSAASSYLLGGDKNEIPRVV